jgi:uncharacterized membrane-anchored protein
MSNRKEQQHMTMTDTAIPLARNTGEAASKVAAITIWFWIMKIAATTLGETAGDMLSMTWDIGYAASSILLLGLFLVALLAQLRSQSFHPALYWTVILATSTAGTTMSDFMDRTLGLGYATGALILVAILILILSVWRWTLGSISVTGIRDGRSEGFYWAAILASNTLGTALGDLIIGGLILAIAGAYYATRWSRTGLFWAAFVLTRPFGATMGDLLTKPADKGGLDLGTIGSSAVLGAVLLILVVREMRRSPRHRPA